MKLLTQAEIAIKSGHSASSIHYIINGDREPSKKMAIDLMYATGVHAAAWMFPEYFFNPYIPIENAVVDGRLWKNPIISIGRWRLERAALWRNINERWELDGLPETINKKGGVSPSS